MFHGGNREFLHDLALSSRSFISGRMSSLLAISSYRLMETSTRFQVKSSCMYHMMCRLANLITFAGQNVKFCMILQIFAGHPHPIHTTLVIIIMNLH